MKKFFKWYWRRAKELPLVCVTFGAGSFYGALIASGVGVAV